MARGSDGKAARNEVRKEKRKEEKERLMKGENEFDFEGKGENEGEDTSSPPEENVNSKKNESDVPIKKKKRKPKLTEEKPLEAPSSSGGIKTLPLLMLILLTGTTLLPAVLFAGDWVSAYISKNNILGSMGHKLGIGPSPKKRVVSFYEKHDPLKVDEVDKILGKYYGEYPVLIKRLERKYADYGYFLNWEQDEAPMTLAMEKIYDTRDYIQKQFNKYAPQQLKLACRNIKYNLTTLYKKSRKVWKKHLWPLLEPIIGNPEGSEAQKKKDRSASMDKKGRRKKNTEFRDD